MSIIVNGTTVTKVNYKSPAGVDYTPPYVMVRKEKETGYEQYNWKYVHNQSGYSLTDFTDSCTVVRDWNTFFVTLPSGYTFRSNYFYHIIIGYVAGGCSTASREAWVDIIVRYIASSYEMNISSFGPNADLDAVINASLYNDNERVLKIDVMYPVVPYTPQAYFKLHGVYRRFA